MLQRWSNKVTGDIGVAFVSSNDESLLCCLGYEHFAGEDYKDETACGILVQVWKPVNKTVGNM